MSIIENVYGAKAKIFIKYENSIEELANILSNGLMLSEFVLEHSEYPPYDITGSCEALGFEIWLEPSNNIEGYEFLLKIETEDSLKEAFSNQMHDMSPWLARFVSKMCDVETLVINFDDRSGVVFAKGELRRLDSIKVIGEVNNK